ncbi:MAG TPA: hypothetical protein VK174_16610 [Chitinophagales bacterium]|nr:hypothetical protein [Chitinophagales bacterium]
MINKKSAITGPSEIAPSTEKVPAKFLLLIGSIWVVLLAMATTAAANWDFVSYYISINKPGTHVAPTDSKISIDRYSTIIHSHQTKWQVHITALIELNNIAVRTNDTASTSRFISLKNIIFSIESQTDKYLDTLARCPEFDNEKRKVFLNNMEQYLATDEKALTTVEKGIQNLKQPKELKIEQLISSLQNLSTNNHATL